MVNMTDIDCVFCRIATNKSDLIWESTFLYAIFDQNPVNPGHALIIPKRHVVCLEDLTTEEWNEYKTAISDVVKIIEKTDLLKIYSNMLESASTGTTKWFLNKALNSQFLNTKPDAYNHGVNNGRAAGRTVDHLHWQVIPRYKGDVEDPRGGVRFVVPEMGNYKISR